MYNHISLSNIPWEIRDIYLHHAHIHITNWLYTLFQFPTRIYLRNAIQLILCNCCPLLYVHEVLASSRKSEQKQKYMLATKKYKKTKYSYTFKAFRSKWNQYYGNKILWYFFQNHRTALGEIIRTSTPLRGWTMSNKYKASQPHLRADFIITMLT